MKKKIHTRKRHGLGQEEIGERANVEKKGEKILKDGRLIYVHVAEVNRIMGFSVVSL